MREAQPDGYLRGRIEHDSDRGRYYAAEKEMWVETDVDAASQTKNCDLNVGKDICITREIMHHSDGASDGYLCTPGWQTDAPQGLININILTP